MTFAAFFITALTAVASVSGELSEQLECPEDCDCHYYRINWVTDCSESNLTSVPWDGLDHNVYVLNMDGNNLKELPPFPEDFKVRTIQLADNAIGHIANDTFAKLPYLLDIDLSGNNITSIDPAAFVNNNGLITIDLQSNPLEYAEGPFLMSKSLRSLYLANCKFTKLSGNFFANATGINTLDLSGNPLRILEAGIFDDLANLETLSLNNCNLTHIASVAFNSLEHLKTLELGGNDLKGQADWPLVLGSLGRLESLNLRSAGLSNLPDGTFDKNPWMRTMILAENQLADFDVAVLGRNLQHLDTLDLSYCHLREPLSEFAFLNATKLRTLMLSGNHLSAAFLSEALSSVPKLQTLSLRDCGLTRLPANIFQKLLALRELDISYNPLNNAFTGLLSPLESLERLDMGYSNLKTIAKDTFVKMSALKTLILSGNKLERLESGLFQNLTALETLELNYCGLSTLNEAVFYENFTYPDLEELRLAGNPLKVPPEDGPHPFLPAQLGKLKILDLRSCSLSRLPADAFVTAKNITKLFLADNKFSNGRDNKGRAGDKRKDAAVAAVDGKNQTDKKDFNRDKAEEGDNRKGSSNDAVYSTDKDAKVAEEDDTLAFLEPLKHLQLLDLSNNNLSHITPKTLENNGELTALKLAGNPWKCDCNIVDMWQWASMERGDIGVLVGSTTTAAAADSIGNPSSKRKKALLCSLDTKTTPIKEGKLRKPGRELLNNVNRTWARYVREADCPWNYAWKPARILTKRTKRSSGTAATATLEARAMFERMRTERDDQEREWREGKLLVAAVVSVAAVILVAIFIFGRFKRDKN